MSPSHLRLPRAFVGAIALSLPLLLAGCDQLGIETGAVTAAKKEAEGKAIGSACRHALRAIEDCYTLNPKASKAAVFTGWREMDEYMRENKIEGIVPVVPRKAPAAASAPSASAAEGKEGAAEEAAPPPAAHGKIKATH
ncbi:MAG: hypothetical protein RL722_232 [Pseudomonadota bacterium]|jgi:hypothetical protein